MSDGRHTDPVFGDALFRQKRKHGKFRVVEAPRLEAAVADTHAHVHLLPDPALAFAQAAVWGVSFICNIVDVCEDGPEALGRVAALPAAAAARLPQVAAATEAALAQAAVGEGATRLPEGCGPEPFALPPDAAARPMPHLRIAVGCHPHNASSFDADAEARLRACLADPLVCAVGEIGLDYHYDFSPREAQREAFRRQVRLAHEAGLPVALHIREAHDEALAIMREEGFPAAGTLLHCFDLGWDVLEPWIDEGCRVALGGALTFARCEDTREAVRRVPLERLLTETDAPYMAPEPMRGMTCGPAHVAFTAARMAEVRGCAPGAPREALLRALAGNARALLDRPATAWQRAHGAPCGDDR